MTIQTFLWLLAILMAVTSLMTQGIKKVLGDRKYSSNIVNLIDSIVVGICGMLIFYYFSRAKPDPVLVILMTFSVWLSSMGFYDKVVQTIKQIGGTQA